PMRDFRHLTLKLGKENDDLEEEEEYEAQETEGESQIVDRSPRSGKDAVLLDSIPQATSDSLAVKDSLATRIDSTELKVPTDTLILDNQEVEKPKLSRRERRELLKQEKLKYKHA